MQLRSFPVVDRPVEPVPDFRVISLAAPPTAWRSLFSTLQPQRGILPMVALLCGVGAARTGSLADLPVVALVLGLLLVGPLLTFAGLVINRYFDRNLAPDTLTKPLGLSSDALVASIGISAIASLGLAHAIGTFAFNLACVTLATFFALNAPPLRLRRQTWWNGLLTGGVAVLFPWLLGGFLAAPAAMPAMAMPALFAFGAIGLQLAESLAKSQHERQAGLQTLAAVFGPEVGAVLAVMVMETSLIGAAIMAFGAQAYASAGGIAILGLLLLVGQIASLRLPLHRRGFWSGVSKVLFMAAMIAAAAASGPMILQM